MKSIQHALGLNPTVFPENLKTVFIDGCEFVSTLNMAKYFLCTHMQTNCTAAYVYTKIHQTNLQKLQEIHEQLNTEHLNLTLVDSIFQAEPAEGYLLDQFAYSLVLRCMQNTNVIEQLTQLLQDRSMTAVLEA
ncbi:hypothetical protein [Acinetobacter sp. WCHAc060025]|uniref:hypothetical protein n=1 Tax=Acinetobacter sp. WCHAc060025 TaxID=2518625 RepID=UPI001023A689|nr:hypothetical protein [Acinetobacter sp. WCHAc060025]RZG77759.1 hypothetical protein EXE09_02240 [Acinetobacter sp. WCHAc060025]